MSRALATLLQRLGVLSERQLDLLLARGETDGNTLLLKILESGMAEEAEVGRLLASACQLPFLHPLPARLAGEALARIPASLASARMVLPLDFNELEGVLTVALADPTDEELQDELSFRTGHQLRVCVAAFYDLDAAIRRSYFAERFERGRRASSPSSPEPFSFERAGGARRVPSPAEPFGPERDGGVGRPASRRGGSPEPPNLPLAGPPSTRTVTSRNIDIGDLFDEKPAPAPPPLIPASAAGSGQGERGAPGRAAAGRRVSPPPSGNPSAAREARATGDERRAPPTAGEARGAVPGGSRRTPSPGSARPSPAPAGERRLPSPGGGRRAPSPGGERPAAPPGPREPKISPDAVASMQTQTDLAPSLQLPDAPADLLPRSPLEDSSSRTVSPALLIDLIKQLLARIIDLEKSVAENSRGQQDLVELLIKDGVLSRKAYLEWLNSRARP